MGLYKQNSISNRAEVNVDLLGRQHGHFLLVAYIQPHTAPALLPNFEPKPHDPLLAVAVQLPPWEQFLEAAGRELVLRGVDPKFMPAYMKALGRSSGLWCWVLYSTIMLLVFSINNQ